MVQLMIYFLYTRDGRLRLKPALVQDTAYIVEKTYQLAPYVGAFWAQIESEGPHMCSIQCTVGGD